MDTFRRIGATTWAERARDELRATGGTVPTEVTTMTGFTPQELRIVSAVS